MKIRLVIIDSDKSYIQRLEKNLISHYSENLELYFLTELTEPTAENFIEESDVIKKADIILVSDGAEKVENYETKAVIVDFVEDREVDQRKNIICKYQKTETIYRSILSIYSEIRRGKGTFMTSVEKTETISFTGCAGGVGVTTTAIAYAQYLAKREEKVLYINLEDNSSSHVFFSDNSGFDFGDVLFALKSKKVNLALKIESAITQDEYGVDYIAPVKNPYDMLEFTVDDLTEFMKGIAAIDKYQCVIVDIPLQMSERWKTALKLSHRIVAVNDGSAVGNEKMKRLIDALQMLGKKEEQDFLGRTVLLYNKFSNKTGQVLSCELREIGGIQKYEQFQSTDIVKQVADKGFWDALWEK